MSILSFFGCSSNKSLNSIIEKDKIIISRNIGFETKNKLVYERLKNVFGEDSDYIYEDKDRVLCQIPTFIWGHNLLEHKLDLIYKIIGEKKIRSYYYNVLLKKVEEWEMVNNAGTRVTYDPIKPEELLIYLNHLLEQEDDLTNYVWYLDSSKYNPEDYYKGVYCKFTTLHTNPVWEFDFNKEKRDYCKVSERYEDNVIDWIPLTEGKIIKGENITLTAKKIHIDKIIRKHAEQIIKMCKIAIEYNLELTKDNDG